jgi:hypothetical protein
MDRDGDQQGGDEVELTDQEDDRIASEHLSAASAPRH